MAKKSATGGMSPKRLKRLTRAMQGAVDRGEVAGVQTLIFRHGEEAHFDLLGWQDDRAKIKLKRDTIFRIASMSKPITSVAALMLLEEGKFALSDPVDRWLPELADMKVLRSPTGPLNDTYKSPHRITVADLFTHRSGLVSSLTAMEGPIAAKMGLLTTGLGLRTAVGVDEWMKRLGSLPLVYEPGTTVNYGFSTDVLGFLVGRVSGMPFEEFLRTRLFEPLGMNDTGFWVPKKKLGRLAVNFANDPKTGKRVVDDHPRNSKWAKPPSVPSGAGGLVSTIDDYLQFARMLLQNGKIGRTRILSLLAIELMNTVFLTPEQRHVPFFGMRKFWAGEGFGLGVWVLDNLAGHAAMGSVGQYGWGGAYGTMWFNDPAEDMVCLMMIQLLSMGPATQIARDFNTLIYQAIDD